jgi:hypothetical protein
MTDEEMAEEYAEKYFGKKTELVEVWKLKSCKENFLAGLKLGRPQWHKVADGDLPKGDDCFGKNGIHRNIYLKDRYGSLYTGNYFPKDETHKEDCFAVEFLEWGFQGTQFCAKEQISEWCEIPTFDKE